LHHTAPPCLKLASFARDGQRDGQRSVTTTRTATTKTATLESIERHLAGLAAKTAGKTDLLALEERLDARIAAMESRHEQRLLLMEARIAAVLREMMAAIAAPFPPA